MSGTIHGFANSNSLEVVDDDRFPFYILTDNDRDYFSLESGLVVCSDDTDVFVMHTFDKERDVLDDQSLSDMILPQRMNDLRDMIDNHKWSSLQAVSTDKGLSDPYKQGLLVEFSTDNGLENALKEATEFVRSVDTNHLVETLYNSFIGYPVMEYESETHNSTPPERKRVGHIDEWSFDFIRVSVLDIDNVGDGKERSEQMVGRVLADSSDVPYKKSHTEPIVEIVPPSDASVIAENEERTYRVGLKFNVNDSV